MIDDPSEEKLYLGMFAKLSQHLKLVNLLRVFFCFLFFFGSVLESPVAVLQYLPGGPVSEGIGPPGGILPAQARNYFGDVLTGLMYLHSQVGVGG